MNQDIYVDCLRDNFIPWYSELPPLNEGNYTFQEDNAPCHKGSFANWWKEKQPFEVMETWPAQSPDLNPIEHVQSVLSKEIKKRKPEIYKIEDLYRIPKETWAGLEVEYAEKLVKSMHDRCQAVIKAKGDVTAY